MGFEIYHTFKGTEATNPPKWFDTLKWGAGKGVELAMVQVLKDSGIVDTNFDQANEETFQMERNGVIVRMKIDAMVSKNAPILNADSPIEIKSINNKNAMDIKKYAEECVGTVDIQDRGGFCLATRDKQRHMQKTMPSFVHDE